MRVARERVAARRSNRTSRCLCAARRRFPALVAALLTAAVTACGRGGREPSDVVLVVIDTLRADRLGCYGNGKGLTPFLDELASRGTVFSRAYAASSWTVPSVASLFTSRYPSQHHVTTFDAKLPAREVTLAERLAGAGYVTAGFVANFRLERKLGYAQGFSVWDVYRNVPAELRRPALRWVKHQRAQSPAAPQLLYLHYMQPHSPYEPPGPVRARLLPASVDQSEVARLNAMLRQSPFDLRPEDIEKLEGLYDGDVASLDARLRKTFGELDELGVLDHAFVVVTADHGEEFHEHGRFQHGSSLFEETVRVPLIFVGPGIAAGRVEENVSLVDVAPTLLDLLGLPPQPSFEGRSLVSRMKPRGFLARLVGRGAGEQKEDVVLELPETGSRIDVRAHSSALVAGFSKLILPVRRKSDVGPAREIYDLASDPGERHPNPPALAGDASRLESELKAKLKALAARTGRAERAPLGKAAKEELRALGYAP
jgi:arylsulfatase A-like enzyme